MRRFFRYTSAASSWPLRTRFTTSCEIRVDRLIGEKTPVQLALHVLRKRCPVATHDLQADELDLLDTVAVPQAGITLAGATRAAARMRQEQFQVQLFEFQLESARHAPSLGNVSRQVGIQGGGELLPLLGWQPLHRPFPHRTNRLSVSPYSTAKPAASNQRFDHSRISRPEPVIEFASAGL